MAEVLKALTRFPFFTNIVMISDETVYRDEVPKRAILPGARCFLQTKE